MAGAKKKEQAPIDRPLSKAYLREFKGWSTAYPPGLSDPTSLRHMENVQITREGGARIRPALRSVFEEDIWLDQNYGSTMVGGFEHFFLNDGRKALLFAAREASGVVGFKVGVQNPQTGRFTIRGLTHADVGFSIPQGESVLNFTSATTFVRYLQIDNKIFALSDGGEDLRLFSVGATKKARKVTPITVPAFTNAHTLTVVHPDAAWINTASKVTNPAAETPIASTLISSTAANNSYSYGFFYTFENEIGESAASQIQIIKASRAWSQWRFLRPAADGAASSTSVSDPAMAMDQLVATLPSAVYTSAIAQNALKWNLYMFTWSDQDALPPEAVLVGSQDLTNAPTYAKNGWIQCTAAVDLGSSTAVLPTAANRHNYSDPSSASQGLVAGDRLVLVNDRENGALIRWSSNLVGEYTNFTPTKGGGFKTLTSGNLYIPAAVKLWQNPQSVDTITILCSGVDGQSTAFYMAPASVDGQTSSSNVMGFEETTATPGTVSPYGVEVFNNALYHPLDTELMKSTASNYNINHSTMTEDISNRWASLINKDHIISAQHDSRLYYLVHNPDGAPLEDNCNGNELWVFDGAKDQGSWSRWLVQGIALSKLEIAGRLYLGLARPEGIFIFDEDKVTDDTSSTGGTVQTAIPWKLVTNTQGANRAHDAWARLQQANVTLGNFRGSMKYGIRGLDINGRLMDINKIYHSKERAPYAPLVRPDPWDIADFLAVRLDMMEWYFYAESIEDDEGNVRPSAGQISLVQYRYVPSTVNTGYEYGSVETFEYGNDTVLADNTNTFNGVPEPYIDSSRP